MPSKIYPLNFLPGIKKDGTSFASRHYLDGHWCRFQRGLPRKMGGYRQILSVPHRPHGMLIVPQGQDFRVILGDSDALTYFMMGENGNALSGLVNRTAEGFIADVHNTWQFQTLYTAGRFMGRFS